MTIAIRRATLDDLAAICTLGHEVNLLHVAARPDLFAPADDAAQHEPRWRRAIEREGHAVFLAERAGTAAGFVTAHVADEPSSYFLPVRLCHVGSLGVAAAERGRGIGRALMAALEAWAVEQDAGEVHLTVWQFNARARRLYAELGYEERTTLMCKRLGGTMAEPPARAIPRP